MGWWPSFTLGPKHRDDTTYSITQGMRAGTSTWAAIIVCHEFRLSATILSYGHYPILTVVLQQLFILFSLAIPDTVMSLQPGDLPGFLFRPVKRIQDFILSYLPFYGNTWFLIGISILMLFMRVVWVGIPWLKDEVDWMSNLTSSYIFVTLFVESLTLVAAFVRGLVAAVMAAGDAAQASSAGGKKEEKKEKKETKGEGEKSTVKEEDEKEEKGKEAEARERDRNATKGEEEKEEEEESLLDSEGGPGHEHKACAGGPASACECMLQCEVFGAAPEKCKRRSHADKRKLVDQLIKSTMLSHHDMCAGMRCIKNCAQELGCLDEKVQQDCGIVETNYEMHRLPSEPRCKLHCSA
mmetsp:Transcript_36230/g.115271  ORF Transcript_36230/g.115271 Transcript_36230/m.115271 type:complete len:353 (+) Transcript_36230:96-1154(+)